MTTQVDLGEFEGRIVTKSTIAVKKAGDGLSAAQRVEPVLFRQGDTVFVVLECTVGTIHFVPHGEEDAERRADLNCEAASVIDAPVVKEALQRMKDKIATLKAMERGERELPLDESLRREHRAGFHRAIPEPECPYCSGAETDPGDESAPDPT
jgi:hypothetical protein